MQATESTSGGCTSILGPKIHASYQAVWFGRYGKHPEDSGNYVSFQHADLD